MAGKVFVSCGQSTSEEKQVVSLIEELLIGQGFDPYVAIQVQSIQDVNSGIIGELKKSDFYVFVDFKREAIDEGQHRGSLFTNQELAIAYVLGFENVIFLQQEGVGLEGLLKYMGANPVRFTSLEDVPSLLERLLSEKSWNPAYSRHLVVNNLRGLPGTVTVENPFDHWHAKPFYVDVKNKRTDIGAERTQIRLAYITKLPDGQRRRYEIRSPIKVDGARAFNQDIWPGDHGSFELFFVDKGHLEQVYFQSAWDALPLKPIITGVGTYRLDYEGWARNFPMFRFSVTLQVTGDLETTTAELIEDPHWEN